MSSTTIALLSGGLDSATAAALAREAGHRVIGLSFDYGQRHQRELGLPLRWRKLWPRRAPHHQCQLGGLGRLVPHRPG